MRLEDALAVLAARPLERDGREPVHDGLVGFGQLQTSGRMVSVVNVASGVGASADVMADADTA